MKLKQLITKSTTKSAAFLMIGATIIGSGATMNVYAKDIPSSDNIKITTCGNHFDTACKPTSPNFGTCNPDSLKPNTTPSLPGADSKPDIDTSKPGTDVSKPNTDTSKPDTNVSSQAAFENQVLDLVNVERQKAGLKPLQMDESVRNVARLKSEDMRKNNYFDHTSPTYGSPFDMLKQFNVSYRSAGENIAQGYTTPEAVVQGWMNSSGHRANILNSSYTHIGIGYDSNGHYWTQMFIGK